MNYKKSKDIKKEIEKAEKILLNCHRGPDPDSIGSALALYIVLKKLGKKVEIICPSEELFDPISNLKGYEKIKNGVDFSTFKFSKYDLFITLDSSSWNMVSGSGEISIPDIKMIVIDHHKTNTKYGKINLVDEKTSSVGELLYQIFEDWGVDLDKDISNCLLSAIIGDTGTFRFPNTTKKTFYIASKLIENGADKNRLIRDIYMSEPYNLLKFYALALVNLKIDKKHKFAWSAVKYEDYKKLGEPENAKNSTASMFAQSVEGTNFGIIMVELKKGLLALSFRSRSKADISQIAKTFGGGGHAAAAGAKVEGLEFKDAVKKVLEVSKKYAEKFEKENSKG